MWHELKTWPVPFQCVWDGSKRAEFRKFDRDFKVGDILKLDEWNPEEEKYTNRVIHSVVTHVQGGGEFGIPEGYCMMSLSTPDRFMDSVFVSFRK